jgi:predicted dehydrogenase
MANKKKSEAAVSRRQFISSSALGAAAAAHFLFTGTGRSAANDEKIRVGVIGCGGRGTGAALNLLLAQTKVIYPPPRSGYHTEDAVPGARVKATGVEIVALADLFQNRLDHCRAQLKLVGNEVSDHNCFVGFDAYEKVVSLPEVNYVVLASPPQFRPREIRAAVEAGKHVFAEKPVAVDAPGARSVIESGEMAKEKGLGFLAGTVRRHSRDIMETVKRLRDGAVGEILEARAYFNIGELWTIPREPGWGDAEWQLRNWNYFTWLSGDCIVEQHIHNLDEVNWIMGEHPVRAYGMGGRISRTSDEFGNIYDHFSIEYEYANGTRLFSQNRQIANGTNRVGVEVLGRKGTSNCQDSITGDTKWHYDGEKPDGYEAEHRDLIESIRAGKPLNEARDVAESTLTAIMGREAAYSGKVIEWDAVWNSKRDYTPERYQLGNMPFPEVVNPKTYKFY